MKRKQKAPKVPMVWCLACKVPLPQAGIPEHDVEVGHRRRVAGVVIDSAIAKHFGASPCEIERRSGSA